MASVYDFETPSLSGGSTIKLADLRGQVVLIVNTASACGFTPQYKGLQALYERYRDQGFVVVGFPCNQFGGQEPGGDDEIQVFCERNYGVSFPLSTKVDVNGKNAHPLWSFLTSEKPGLLGIEAIKWNFTKFLVGRDGTVLKRYAPTDAPESLVADIEKALVKPQA